MKLNLMDASVILPLPNQQPKQQREMATIELTKGLSAIVDDDDFVWLSSFKWHAATHGSRGLFCAATGHRAQLMHRMIMKASPTDCVDHIDGDPLNNQRINLRLCTRQQNQWNRRSVSNKTGIKGIFRQLSGTYTAQIRINGRLICLGTYKTMEQAALAYDKSATELFKDYAATNEQLGLIRKAGEME